MEIHVQRSLTIHCPVQLGLTDGRSLDAVLYLLTDPLRPGGTSSIESVLEGPREFLPIGVGKGSAIIAKSAIRTLEIAADAPGAPDFPTGGGSFDVATLHLDSGMEVSGVLCTLASIESMRMSDLFNRPGRFLPLAEGDRVVFVSKAHIVFASF